MCYPLKDHRLPILILIISLTCLIAFTAQSPVTSAQSGGGAPLRLRLKVEKNTLQPGEVTTISVEFLDSEYRQVPNDRTRLVLFEGAATRSREVFSGAFSPTRISVGPGAWSGTASFTATQASRLMLKASSAELDAARALVLITKAKVSLSQSFEPVAFPQSDADLILDRLDPFGATETTASQPLPANNATAAQFSITVPPSASEGRTLKITTDANTRIFYRKLNEAGSKAAAIDKMGSICIPVPKGTEIVDGLNVFSSKEGSVVVKVELSPEALTAQTTVQFEKPRPTHVMFYQAPPTISPAASMVPITIELGDQGKVKIAPDKEYQILVTSPTDPGVVRFAPEPIPLSSGRPLAKSQFQLLSFPPRGQIQLLAQDKDGVLHEVTHTLLVDSLIRKIVVNGPTELPRGGKEAEFTIHLEDKDGKPLNADWDRKIELSVDDGELTDKQVTILKDHSQTVVKWHLPGSGDKAILAAESFPLDAAKHPVRILFTPSYQLVLIALLGGVIGGFARQLHKGDRLVRIRPIWTGEDWDLGLMGRISGSVISGLFLYWAMKLGLARVNLDLGSMTVAVFFGGIGGFAGLVVLERLVEWCFQLFQWALPWGKKAAGTEPTSPPNTSAARDTLATISSESKISTV